MNGCMHLHEGDQIYRYEVPVDDDWHVLLLRGDPLAVGCRDPRTVEFWAPTQGLKYSRAFRVVGTGHPIPAETRYWGTVTAPGGALVWHLLERLLP